MTSQTSNGRRPRVLYVQYTNPAAYPPIEHSAHILADREFDVLLIGTNILGDSLVIKPHARIQLKLRAFRKGGWRQKVHYASFLLWAVRQAIHWRPDWIYASDPLSCPIALAMRRASGARVIYHEHDSPADRDMAATSWFMRRVLAARTRLARVAAACVLPNEDRAKHFRDVTGRRDVLTVWNCPMRADVASSRDSAADGLRVLYHGSIVPARLPLSVIDALASLPSSVSLTIAGYETAGHAGHVAALQSAAVAAGIADRVRYVGTVPAREDLMRQCAACDVGLALMPLVTEDPNEGAMVGASNKVFDYMAGGLPVLVSDRPDWRTTFVDAGFGASCDPASSASIAGALSRWLCDPATRVAMGERGRRKIAADWNYEASFAPVLALVSRSAQGI
jgi:glycosyltransferase involved in cell wall biosynthesis